MGRSRAERAARQLDKLLERENVRVITRNGSSWELGAGETRARGTLMRIMRIRGEEFLADVLRAIREPGELRSDTIRAVEQIFVAFPNWRDMDMGADVSAVSFTVLRRHAPKWQRDRIVFLANRMTAALVMRRWKRINGQLDGEAA